MPDAQTKPTIIFFLGAGASKDAGLPDVGGLVDKLNEWLKSKLNTDQTAAQQLSIIENIVTILRDLKTKGNGKTPLDVEILLETIEKIENRDEDVLSSFYNNTSLKIESHPAYSSVFNGKKELSSQIKRLIRSIFSDTTVDTSYLKPLNSFILDYTPLSIFSTNYDVCIEQFCMENAIKFVDGFNPRWNPETEYERQDDIKIRLYKLHGSITWYMSEIGDYIRSDIIVTQDRPTIVGGKEIVPLILYPGWKLKYIEPVIWMLVKLALQLEKVDYVFIIGYSFKDSHITRLFRYVAERNRRFVIFFISPSAYRIYDQRLRCHEDDQFQKTDRLSQLNGRVICLNYRFKDIFPELKNQYLKNLINNHSRS